MEQYKGRWRVMKAENADDVVTILGIPPEKRESMKQNWFIHEFSQVDEERWKVVINPGTSHCIDRGPFKMGESIEAIAQNGSPVKITYTFVDGEFREDHQYLEDPALNFEVIKTFLNGQLTAELQKMNTTARIYFDRV